MTSKQRGKKVFVFDATPLIYLAKSRVLGKINFPETEDVITRSVYQEVVGEGLKKGHSDALYVGRLIAEGLFKLEDVAEQHSLFMHNKNLSNADKEILSFCKQNHAILISDDEEIRISAEIGEVEHHGSAYVLFKLLKSGIINKLEFKETLDKMIEEGWYCSTDLYNDIIDEWGKWKK